MWKTLACFWAQTGPVAYIVRLKCTHSHCGAVGLLIFSVRYFPTYLILLDALSPECVNDQNAFIVGQCVSPSETRLKFRWNSAEHFFLVFRWA